MLSLEFISHESIVNSYCEIKLCDFSFFFLVFRVSLHFSGRRGGGRPGQAKQGILWIARPLIESP